MFGPSQNVCKYEKFGFCKERDSCSRYHPKALCDKDSCDVTSCNKRHPMPCRNFIKGECRFGNICKFDHRKQKNVKKLEDKTESLEKEIKDLKARLNNQDATINGLKEMIQNLKLKFKNQEGTVEVLKENLETTEENLVGVMRQMHEYEQYESTPAKKRKLAYKDIDSEAETTMGDEVSVMELDDAMTDLSYAEKLQAEDPKSNFRDNQFIGQIVADIRWIYEELNTAKISETYDKILNLKNDIDEEMEDDGLIEDKNILDNVTKNFDKYFPKINPKNKKNFKKIVKEMCEQILKDEEKVHKQMTNK